MAEDYTLQEDTAPAPGRLEQFLRVFIILAVICLGGEIIWLLGITPFRPFSKIDVSGYDGIGKEEILARAGVTRGSSYVSADTHRMEKALMGLSSLESVRVFKRFPDKLQIVLGGRKAVATAVASLNGRMVQVLIDGQGVIFHVGGDIKDGVSGQLPIVSGLVIEDPAPGMRLPAMLVPLFRELDKIGASAPELLGAVSELRISGKPFESYEIVLYPMHRKVKVRLSGLNEDLLRYTLLMVDVLASREPGIDSLDFRSSIASYIPKEASSE